MSNKTENIYRLLDRLEDLQNEISIINQLGRNQDTPDAHTYSQRKSHLENIEFQLKQDLKSLRFWINSLYAYNGKSKSHAKQEASKENGKMGGRPPKEITQARRRIKELEEEWIPQAQEKQILILDSQEEEKLKKDLENYREEVSRLKEKVSDWLEKRRGEK